MYYGVVVGMDAELMKVSEIMTENPVTVTADDTLRTAVERMHEYNCRRLPVISRDGHVVGVVTDRDCRLASSSPYTAAGDDWDKTHMDRITVRMFMTAAPIITLPTADVSDVATLMLRYKIGGLPVMNGETLVGIITTSDILTAFIRMCRQEDERSRAENTLQRSD